MDEVQRLITRKVTVDMELTPNGLQRAGTLLIRNGVHPQARLRMTGRGGRGQNDTYRDVFDVFATWEEKEASC
jgi:hypothetical protein